MSTYVLIVPAPRQAGSVRLEEIGPGRDDLSVSQDEIIVGPFTRPDPEELSARDERWFAAIDRQNLILDRVAEALEDIAMVARAK